METAIDFLSLLSTGRDRSANPEELRRRKEQQRVEAYNATIASDDGSGVRCASCNGRGMIGYICEETGTFTVRYCRCHAERVTALRLKRIGLLDRSRRSTFENFRTDSDYQRRMKHVAQSFVENPNGWLAFFGQSGAGKTHLCTAVFTELVRRHGLEGEYLLWNADSRALKAAALDREYDLFDRYKQAQLLYVDDLFKAREGQPMSDADLRLAFELLDHRYNQRSITIISCERSFDELKQLDQAIAGRIREMCGDHLLSIDRDDRKNLRLRSSN